MRASYYEAKDQILSLYVAPYMIIGAAFLKLYQQCGDLRFLCFLSSSQASRKVVRALQQNLQSDLKDLLAFDLALAVNPVRAIESTWPVSEKNQEVWKLFHRHLQATGQDIWLEQHQFETAHHMLKKFVLECKNPWSFIVHMSPPSLQQVGLSGKRFLSNFAPTIFGVNSTLDKLLLARIPVRDWLKLTCCCSQLRANVWMFLWDHPISACNEGDDGLLYVSF